MTTAENLPRITAKGIFIAILISLVLGIGLSEIVLRVAMPHWKEFSNARFMTRVVVPGHKPVFAGRPGFDGYFAQNNGDFRVRIQLNEFGHRNPETVAAADGQIWVIGDSMTFGWGVERKEMYSEILENRIGHPSYNLASPGTDICGYQAMIARMPKNLKPRSVVIGLILENDLHIYNCEAAGQATATQPQDQDNSGGGFSMSELKIFATRNFALYNFLAVSLKRVAAVQDLLVQLKIISQPHIITAQVNPNTIATLAGSAGAELERLRSMLPAGTPFLVLIAANRFEIRDNAAMDHDIRQAVKNELRRRGISTVDSFESFRTAGFAATHFKHDGHWSALGHRIAGEAVATSLKGLQGGK